MALPAFSSPFSRGEQFSSGLFEQPHDAVNYEQNGSCHYSGLSGGRTTLDAGYQLFGGFAQQLNDNPYRANMDDYVWKEENGQYRSPIQGGGDPSTQLPVGDGVVPLMLMVIGYAVWKRRRVES